MLDTTGTTSWNRQTGIGMGTVMGMGTGTGIGIDTVTNKLSNIMYMYTYDNYSIIV